MSPSTQKPRWMYRFENFSRAFLLLRDGVEIAQSRPLTQLEREGLVQRFEYTWELSWKVLKDYLEHEGVQLETITPAATIRASVAAKLIEDGEVWMRALDARNKMAHTYNAHKFEAIVTAITAEYLSMFEVVYLAFHARSERYSHA